MNAEPLASAIVGHLVGDYILQNDLLALNKKRSTLLCAIHCILWTAAVIAFSGWYQSHNAWWVVLILFVTHFAQDRTRIIRWWMHRVGQDEFATGPLSPWSVGFVDNVFHIVTIWIVWRFIA